MRVTPPPVPPAPMATSYPTPLEEGMRYRTPVFAGVAVLMAAAIGVGAYVAITPPSGGKSTNPVGSFLIPYLVLAGFGLTIQAVLLYRVRRGRGTGKLFRGWRGSKNPGRDMVVNVGMSPVLPVLMGSMATWDRAWPLALFGAIGVAQLTLGWLYVPLALRRLSSSSAA